MITANKRRQVLHTDEGVSKRDFPLVKAKILKTSLSPNWEQAQREWTLVGVHEDGDPTFTDVCGLCNHVGLGQNFEIYNTNTNQRFMVGSRCIKRFIVLDGADNLEDSSVLFKIKSEELIAIKILQNLMSAILDVPKAEELAKFRRYAEKIVGNSQKDVSSEKWKQFIANIFVGKKPSKEAVQRISTALYNPKVIKVQRVKMSTAAEQERIGSWSSISKTKTRVDNTLAKSDLYINPQKTVNS